MYDDYSYGGTGAVITAGRADAQLESELENVCRELSLVEQQLAELLAQQSSLCDRRDQISAELKARKKRREYFCHYLSQCHRGAHPLNA